MAIAMLIPLVAYIYITYYAFYGSKLKGEEEVIEVNLLKGH
jgi:fucose permease